jgi:hypothetical protein
MWSAFSGQGEDRTQYLLAWESNALPTWLVACMFSRWVGLLNVLLHKVGKKLFKLAEASSDKKMPCPIFCDTNNKHLFDYKKNIQ